jgi:DnaJ-class molecular chaperone
MADNPIGHYAPEECARCRGTGVGLSRGSSYCPTCSGQGSVAVLQPATKCARCAGNGLDKGSVDEPCPACSGSGWAFHWRK